MIEIIYTYLFQNNFWFSNPFFFLFILLVVPESTSNPKFAVPSMVKHLSFDDQVLKKEIQTPAIKAIHNIPGTIIHRPRAVTAQAQAKNLVFCTPTSGSRQPETIIVSTKNGEVHSVRSKNQQQNTPLLEKDQVVHSLRIVKPHAQRQIQFNKPFEGTGTVSILSRSLLSPEYDMASLNETSPLVGNTFINRTLKRNMVEVETGKLGEKRIRLDLPTPPCGSVSTESDCTTETGPLKSTEVKIIKRINSMPPPSSGGTVKAVPHIIVHRLNRQSAIEATPVSQRITVQMSNESSSSTCTSLLQSAPRPGTGRIVIENFSGVSSAPISSLVKNTSNSSSTPIPIKIIANPNVVIPSNISPSPITITRPSPTPLEAFTPPLTPNSTSVGPPPIANSATIVHPSSITYSMSTPHAPVSLRKVLTTTSNALPNPRFPSHSSGTSPFKVVIPSSSSKQPSATYLLKVPTSGKLSKTASM